MEKVLGIGGLFFRAQDPQVLANWYETHLGINPVPTDYGHQPWIQTEGPTVFAPFPADSDMFGRPTQNWMINFRVTNLVAICDQLIAQGIKVEIDPIQYPNGFFARLSDPEGNPIQLWEAR